jgi:hypothetical protein
MWRSVDLVWTDVLEERIASIFRVQKSACKEPAWAGGCNPPLSDDEEPSWKVKLSCAQRIKHYAMNAYGGVDV